MKKKNLFVATMATLTLLLSACDIGVLNASSVVTISDTGKASGYYKSEVTPERWQYLSRTMTIESSVKVQDLSYTWDAGTCRMTDVHISFNSGALPLYWTDSYLAFAGLEFENLEDSATFVGYGVDTPNQWENFVQDAAGSFECTNPGAYVSNSGWVGTSWWDIMTDGIGLEQWDYSQMGRVALGNIHPTEVPYVFALQSICAPVQLGCEAPSEVGSELNYLLSQDSDFGSAISERWAKGRFTQYLNDNGIETYRTAEGGWGVKVSFSDKIFSTLFRENIGNEMNALPALEFVDGVQYKMYANETHWTLDEDEITDPADEIQIWQMDSQAKTSIAQRFKVAGLLFDTNGVYNKKKKTISWSLTGFGPDANVTATEPYVYFAVGQPVTFKANSSKLTAVAKKLLAKKKSVINGYGDTVIGVVTNSSLTLDKVAANEALAEARGTAIKNYLVNKLHLNHTYVVQATASAEGSNAFIKASVNSAVVTAFGLPTP